MDLMQDACQKYGGEGTGRETRPGGDEWPGW